MSIALPSERDGSSNVPKPSRFAAWRWFAKACTGMTIAQIEEAAGVPWGTIFSWSVDDKIPEATYIAVRDFPGEKRRL